MTIVFSAVSHFLITITVDSAVTLDFENSTREYTTGQKSHFFDGVGSVATWGDRDHNHIWSFLEQQHISSATHAVDDLARLVYRYLTEEYRPIELNLEVGYHVAGFDRLTKPRLFHVFCGFDQPRPQEQVSLEYKMYDHSPSAGQTMFLYNGRHDLADVAVRTFVQQLQSGNAIHQYLTRPYGLPSFGDFVVRFASEITPEVAPPFVTYMIARPNRCSKIINNALCPISQDEVLMKLRELGYQY